MWVVLKGVQRHNFPNRRALICIFEAAVVQVANSWGLWSGSKRSGRKLSGNWLFQETVMHSFTFWGVLRKRLHPNDSFYWHPLSCAPGRVEGRTVRGFQDFGKRTGDGSGSCQGPDRTLSALSSLTRGLRPAQDPSPCLSCAVGTAWPPVHPMALSPGWTLDPCGGLASSPVSGPICCGSRLDSLVGPWTWFVSPTLLGHRRWALLCPPGSGLLGLHPGPWEHCLSCRHPPSRGVPALAAPR